MGCSAYHRHRPTVTVTVDLHQHPGPGKWSRAKGRPCIHQNSPRLAEKDARAESNATATLMCIIADHCPLDDILPCLEGVQHEEIAIFGSGRSPKRSFPEARWKDLLSQGAVMRSQFIRIFPYAYLCYCHVNMAQPTMPATIIDDRQSFRSQRRAHSGASLILVQTCTVVATIISLTGPRQTYRLLKVCT